MRERIKRKVVKWALSWIAMILVSLTYTDKRSRFLDRLLALSEEND